MNKTIPFILGRDFVSIVFKNQPMTIYKNDARFHRVLTCINSSNWEDLESALSTAKALAKYSAGNIAVFENTITFKGQPVNNAVTDRIFEFIREQLPFEPLVKFLDKLMLNPVEDSRNQLYTYLEKYKMPITDEGNVMAMKAVTSSFWDKWTGKINNSVGQEPQMPREEVSTSSDCHCGPGLHHGWYSFVANYGSGDDVAILTEFSPTDVCRIPNDSLYQKIVVCKYKVLKDLGPVKDIKDFESNYAPQTSQAKDVFNSADFKKASQVKEVVKEIKEKFQPKQVTIGADKAYEIVKAGGKARSGSITVSKPKSRAYFRQHSNWKQV